MGQRQRDEQRDEHGLGPPAALAALAVFAPDSRHRAERDLGQVDAARPAIAGVRPPTALSPTAELAGGRPGRQDFERSNSASSVAATIATRGRAAGMR